MEVLSPQKTVGWSALSWRLAAMGRGPAAAALVILAAGSLSARAAGESVLANNPVAADVPLVESSGFPCVQAAIGGGPPLIFAIDTGNVNSLLDTKVAQGAGLKLSGFTDPSLAGMFRGVVPSVGVGPLALDGLPVLVMDLAANQMPPGIAGTLAYTAFKDRILEIDWVKGRVRVSGLAPRESGPPAEHDRFELVTFGKAGPPIVVARGFAINGFPVTAQVDTMFSGTLLVYSDSILKLGLAEAAKTQNMEFFPYTDGGVKMRYAGAAAESFHALGLGAGASMVYFPTPGVHEPDGLFDATVGVALLRHSVLTLDFRNGTIRVSADSRLDAR
jgi:hypothetical protein